MLTFGLGEWTQDQIPHCQKTSSKLFWTRHQNYFFLKSYVLFSNLLSNFSRSELPQV
jgi:hypothetical protein